MKQIPKEIPWELSQKNLTSFLDDAPAIRKEIDEYLQLDLVGDDIQWDALLEKMPNGWKPIAKSVQLMCEKTQTKVKRCCIKRGLLIFAFHNDDPVIHFAMKMLVSGIVRAATRQCMVVPNTFGIRRKDFTGWPCISLPIFTKYVNQLVADGEL